MKTITKPYQLNVIHFIVLIYLAGLTALHGLNNALNDNKSCLAVSNKVPKENSKPEDQKKRNSSVLYLIGDSTVSDYNSGYYPRTGWGQVLQNYFDNSEITVDNRAISGTSAKSFYIKHWSEVINDVQPGDYVFVQFGINDSANDDRYTKPFEGFQDYLTLFVNETQAKGATCVLVSTLRRNAWNDTFPPTVYNAYHDYPVATRQLASELQVPLIDLDTETKPLLESVGKLYSSRFLYMNLEPNEYPKYPNGANDNVHFQRMGSIEMAKLVTNEINQQAALYTSMQILAQALTTTYQLNISKNLEDAGLVTRTQNFPSDLDVSLKALVYEGYNFLGWQDENGQIINTDLIFNLTTQNQSSSFTALFEIDTTCPPITAYTKINNNDAEKVSIANVNSGDTVTFSPTSLSGGTWSWSGPNAFVSNSQEIVLSNIQENQAGEYIVNYTSEAGCVTTKTFNAIVDGRIGEDGVITATATTNADEGTITLTWTLSNIQGSLQILRDTDDDPAGRSRIATISGSSTSYVDENVFGGVTYYYWIKAEDINGNTQNSNAASATAEDNSGTTSIYLEAECGNVGDLWNVVSDTNASNNQYVTIQSGNNSNSSVPNANGHITYAFSVTEPGNYQIWARTIAPSVTDDSFWVGIDNSNWYTWNNISPSTDWKWNEVRVYNLDVGEHQLTFTYREDGTKLDKILITNTRDIPTELGLDANNCENLSSLKHEPNSNPIVIYPNPVENVFFIKSELLNRTIKIYDINGRLLLTKKMTKKMTSLNLSHLKSGVYFIKSDDSQGSTRFIKI